MKINNEEETLSSGCGVVLTLFLAVLMMSFIYKKVLTWHLKKDVDVMGVLKSDYFHDTDKFNAEDGLFIAAGITSYDSNTTLTEEPRYGELVFYHEGWGDQSYTDERLEHHYCSDEELGLVESESSLTFPLRESQRAEVNIYKNKMKCIDAKDYEVWGDFNSA